MVDNEGVVVKSKKGVVAGIYTAVDFRWKYETERPRAPSVGVGEIEEKRDSKNQDEGGWLEVRQERACFTSEAPALLEPMGAKLGRVLITTIPNRRRRRTRTKRTTTSIG